MVIKKTKKRRPLGCGLEDPSLLSPKRLTPKVLEIYTRWFECVSYKSKNLTKSDRARIRFNARGYYGLD